MVTELLSKIGRGEIGNRESGIGNRESGIGSRESGQAGIGTKLEV